MASKFYNAIIDTANTALDGSGAVVDIVTGGANGTRVDNVNVKALGITTAGMVRLFLKDGSTVTLLTEMDVTAVPSPGSTTKTFEDNYEPVKLTLGSGQKLQAATAKSEEFGVSANVIEF